MVFGVLQQNFRGFQAVCVLVAVLSWLLMRYSATHVQVAVEANISDKPQTGTVLKVLFVIISDPQTLKALKIKDFSFSSQKN